MTLFAVLNFDSVDVNWIFGTWSTPLIVAIVLRLPTCGCSCASASKRGGPEAYWLDLGCHDDYELAMQEFASVRHRPPPAEVRAPAQP